MKKQSLLLLSLLLIFTTFVSCEQKSLYEKWNSDSFSTFANSFLKADADIRKEFLKKLSGVEFEQLSEQITHNEFENNLDKMLFNSFLNQEYNERNKAFYEFFTQNLNKEDIYLLMESIDKILKERKNSLNIGTTIPKLFVSESLSKPFNDNTEIYLNSFPTSQLLDFKDCLITTNATL